MAEVKVLIKGYARTERDTELASATTTLIKDKGINIIVDPGMNRKLLLSSLSKENLSPLDIKYVVLTHTHIDHSILTGIFENALVIDDSAIYSFNGEIKGHDGKIPGTDIVIIKTPGHDQFHCSLIVKTKEYGTVVVAADVFWWPDDKKQETDYKSLLTLEDPYVKNQAELTESRKKILEVANYIIPGHGKMFKVNKVKK